MAGTLSPAEVRKAVAVGDIDTVLVCMVDMRGRLLGKRFQADYFGAVFDGLGAVKAIESLCIQKAHLTPWEVLIMMQLSCIVPGMFLDDTAMLVIVAPLYLPLVAVLGFALIR